MVDYSKWDKLEDLDSDEEEQEGSMAPQVTKLDTPMSVTIGPSGPEEVKPSPPPAKGPSESISVRGL